MDELSFSLFGEIKKKTIFSVNDFQVIFNTDLKTALKLESGMRSVRVSNWQFIGHLDDGNDY